MGKGRDFRGSRRRGFDDDMFSPHEMGDSRPRRPFGGPPREAAADGPPVDATVKWFNPEKGFGFAELADGSGDAFLHVGVLQAAGRDSVLPGTKLRVNVGQGAKGRQIARVLEIDDSGAMAAPPRRAMHPGPRSSQGRPDPATAIELAGTVKWFNPEKGFGFVAAEDGGKDVFVHVSVLERAGIRELAEGQRVTMRVAATPKGREALSLTPMG